MYIDTLVVYYIENILKTDISPNICCQVYIIYLSRYLAIFFQWPHLNNHLELNIGKNFSEKSEMYIYMTIH